MEIMKVNRIFIFIIVAVLLTGGGVGLGIYLSQKNSQPTMAIQISKNEQNNSKNVVFLQINAKNKIIFANFYNKDQSTALQNNQKIIGESVAEFADTFFQNQIEDYKKVEYDIQIFGAVHSNALKIKNAIKKSISKIENDQNNCKINFYIKTQTTNLLQKYQGFAHDKNLEENNEQSVLIAIQKNFNKSNNNKD